MAVLLVLMLLLAFAAGLVLVPFGLPGLWLMSLALLGYGIATGFVQVGAWIIGAAFVLTVLGEILDTWLSFHYAGRYGGSSRAGWGAVAGGIVGALMGTPVPVVGNLVGAFAGAFAGAALMEYSRARQAEGSLRAGWGAVLGRAASAAVKVALGLVIVVLGMYGILMG